MALPKSVTNKVLSAVGFGLQSKGSTPVDSNIEVSINSNKINLKKGKYTSTSGTHYILPKDYEIEITPSKHYAKIVSVAIVEGRGRVFLWVDENEYIPRCLSLKHPITKIGYSPQVEIYRYIASEDFQLPPDFKLIQYIIGRMWLIMCPSEWICDFQGEDNRNLCKLCPISSKRGTFEGAKAFTFSWTNTLKFYPTKAKYWSDPVRGLQLYYGMFRDPHGKEIYELPHFPIRSDEISDSLIYNPREGILEDKAKKEDDTEIMLKMATKETNSEEYEISGIVRTYGRPPLKPLRHYIDSIIKFLRKKFPEFTLQTMTEERISYESQLAKIMKDFLEQVETLPTRRR